MVPRRWAITPCACVAKCRHWPLTVQRLTRSPIDETFPRLPCPFGRDTACAFWARAVAWFADRGVRCERVITDNGACYKKRWAQACAATGTTVKKTRPYRPQTNGKIERFHRILLEEWAYTRAWNSDHERHLAYHGFIHFYNHHRAHGALGWSTPAATLSHLEDNLPGEHS